MAQAQAQAGGGGTPIRIESLSLQELSQLKGQLEQEFEQLNNSLQTVQNLVARFMESKEAIHAVYKPENKGKKTLVPMTNSLFVAGELADTDTVLIDIGTGYYVEKKSKDADDYLNRKIKMLEGEVEKVQMALASRRKGVEQVVGVMQMKIAQQQQAAGGGKE